MISIILSFLAGSIFTLGIFIYLGKRMLRISDESADNEMKKAMKDIELLGSVKYRFKQVEEITEQQHNLMGMASRPSASAAHSKYKNDIVSQLKRMEQDKINIFKSILADGVDPVIGMIVEGGEKKAVKMSEAVAIYETNNQTYPIPSKNSKTDSINPRNGLRIVANNEEKKNEPDSPTVS